MPTLRLSPSVSLLSREDLLVCRSDFVTFELRGPGLSALRNHLVPLLDGTRDLEGIVLAMPGFAPESIRRVIEDLIARGAVEVLDEGARPPGSLERLRLLCGASTEGAHAEDSLRGARLLLIGLEPWVLVTAVHLASMGTGRIGVLDDQVVGPAEAAILDGTLGDLLLGAPRTEALRAILADRRVGLGAPAPPPGCNVTTLRWEMLEALPHHGEGGPWDLAIVAVPSYANRSEIERIAGALHAARVKSLWSGVGGAGAVLGPLVTPGETACAACALSDIQAQPEASPSDPPPIRGAGLAALLGELLTFEVLRVITGFSESPLGGRTTWFAPTSLESHRFTLVRLPWCPACGTGR